MNMKKKGGGWNGANKRDYFKVAAKKDYLYLDVKKSSEMAQLISVKEAESLTHGHII